MLQAIDIVLFTVGSLGAIACVAVLLRSGRWRNPLSGTEIPHTGPSIPLALVVLVAFVFVPYLAVRLVFRGELPEAVTQPGSDAWHWAQIADAIAKLALSALMVGVLVGTRSLPARLRRVGFWRGLGIGGVGVLLLVPVMTVQLQMGQVIWHWMHPDAPAPTHAVLQAFSDNTWGAWGRVQLLAGAVIIAPLAEELLFRGILLQALCRHLRLPWVAIVASGVAFGTLHAQPQDVLPLITMGVLLGCIRLRCGSLWPCVALHVLFNARTMAFALLTPELLEAS
uniref:CAAX prenyl protease 2/Lysostaphin resistance protein A-like domain-containing protein n=1 Tax=uncultured Planctomycetota bacterium TaxID=120965 RepID=A0A5B8JPC6_9BACT|nr:hypothetical protein fos2004AM_00026 [uncultured Planctomycetota bacterium]